MQQSTSTLALLAFMLLMSLFYFIFIGDTLSKQSLLFFLKPSFIFKLLPLSFLEFFPVYSNFLDLPDPIFMSRHCWALLTSSSLLYVLEGPQGSMLRQTLGPSLLFLSEVHCDLFCDLQDLRNYCKGYFIWLILLDRR